MNPKIEVKRSVCTFCGDNCGVHVQDRRIAKTTGNHANPASLGLTVKRLASAIHWLYSQSLQKKGWSLLPL